MNQQRQRAAVEDNAAIINPPRPAPRSPRARARPCVFSAFQVSVFDLMPRLRCSATDHALIQLYELYRGVIFISRRPAVDAGNDCLTTQIVASMTYDDVINTASYFDAYHSQPTAVRRN